jgi:hypothetical protein
LVYTNLEKRVKKTSTLKLRLKKVKVRDLLYKNPIQIFFKLTVYIGKGGQKTNFTFNSISYTFDNQLFTVDIKNNF